MKVLVCGGREFNDYPMLARALDEINPSEIVHGGARGADTLAGQYAAERNLNVSVHYADWKNQGRAAGIIRNQRMLRLHPDIHAVVAFPGGRGTADMIRRAEQAGVKVIKF